MVKAIELLAFVISAAALVYGAAYLMRQKMPKYFMLHVCAAGCFVLEELWVIVNSLMGYGGQDGLLTVRLFGFFGCLCFLLTANIHGFDRLVDDGTNRRARSLALLAPGALLVIFLLYAFSSVNGQNAVRILLGLASLSPALPASYFSLKHLLLPKDEMGFLTSIKKTDIFALLFYAVNFAYPLINLYCPKNVVIMCDVGIALMILILVILCGKGAEKWKTFI